MDPEARLFLYSAMSKNQLFLKSHLIAITVLLMKLFLI